MIKNYITIAFRNLWKHKSFTFLNVFGLSVAFGVAILLGMAAFFDLSYDQFHDHSDRLYQAYYQEQTPKGSEVVQNFPTPFAPSLKTEVPGVDKITRFLNETALVIHNDKQLNFESAYLDEDFFEMFSFKFIEGQNKTSLSDPSSVVITREVAENIFGKVENALGKTVQVQAYGEKKPFIVSAVIDNFKKNSSVHFDMAFNFKSFPEYEALIDKWGALYHAVFIRLQEGISKSDFEKRTHEFSNQYYAGQIKDNKRDGAQPDKNGEFMQMYLMDFTNRHFAHSNNGAMQIRRTFPYLILSVSILILFIASVNFINMSIALSANRMREIGMRKTLGAEKGQLFYQFWSESVFVFVAALLIGIGLATAFLTPFKTLFRTSASFENISTPTFILILTAVVLLITLIAGGYPALMLSKMGTLQALKGKLDAKSGNRVRNVLMVLQFGIAILLISGTMVLYSQLDYMRNKDLGFNKEQVISIPLNGKNNSALDIQLLRNELASQPNIIGISAGDINLGLGQDNSRSASVWGFDYKGQGIHTHMLMSDYDYQETLDLQLLQGRFFSRQFATDSLALVINESMAKQLNESNPLDAQIVLDDSIRYSVIGVIKDYNFEDLNKSIEPLTIMLSPSENLQYAYVRVSPGNLSQSFELVTNTWKKIEPNTTFQASFLDENINRTFKEEEIMTKIISSGSIVAILLSCIGLFAMSVLVVNQRTKEIGVRKIVGASVASITILLTKDFLKLVLIAFVLATPIAWWTMTNYLQGYAYRIDLSLWIFAASGGIAIFIALATISLRTIKAALQNPVKSLRTE